MQTYVVKRGDTLGSIAKTFYGEQSRFTLIVAANFIANPDLLRPGTILVIPDLGLATHTPLPSPSESAPPASAPSAGATISERRLATLHPIVVVRGRALLELCAKRGLFLAVTQGLRTWEEQDVLYAKGRTVPPLGKKYVVTKARGGQSYHNFGLAFDIVVLDAMGKVDWDPSHAGWTEAASVGKSVGLEWGGDWTGFKDIPHYQYTGGVSLADCCDRFAEGGLPAAWNEVR